LSREYGDLRDFNDVPGRFNLNQGYLYFEKVAKGSDCSADWGYRFDTMYGTDAQKMQATGNPSNTWDLGWDHGVYGWALPQAYGEVAYGDLSVIAGHFITPLGYESVLSPQNFFYSHSLQSFNSEPFTHTGVLSKYKTDGGWTIYNGWTLGWDTGFDQFGGGSNYIGGAGYKPNEDFEVVYLTTIGNLGKRSDSEFGYSHAIYFIAMLSEDWEYGLASDYYTSDGFEDDPAFNAEQIGIANYLYYTVSERVALGGRAEWWKSNTVNGESTSFYEITGGLNYWVNANIVIRPEMRYDWAPAEASLGDFQYNRGIFGVDAVITF
jgi:hypothetical protein